MAKDSEWDWSVDFFDTRDLVERIDYLQSDLDDDDEAVTQAYQGVTNPNVEDWTRDDLPGVLGEDERESLEDELKALIAFSEELAMYCGDSLRDGNTVIADDHFEDYAEEMAGDLYGAQIVDAEWPFSHIDWAAAAEALKMDYSEVTDPEGNGWWVRS